MEKFDANKSLLMQEFLLKDPHKTGKKFLHDNTYCVISNGGNKRLIFLTERLYSNE